MRLSRESFSNEIDESDLQDNKHDKKALGLLGDYGNVLRTKSIILDIGQKIFCREVGL
jgi:hypothetical protein